MGKTIALMAQISLRRIKEYPGHRKDICKNLFVGFNHGFSMLLMSTILKVAGMPGMNYEQKKNQNEDPKQHTEH